MKQYILFQVKLNVSHYLPFFNLLKKQIFLGGGGYFDLVKPEPCFIFYFFGTSGSATESSIIHVALHLYILPPSTDYQ